MAHTVLKRAWYEEADSYGTGPAKSLTDFGKGRESFASCGTEVRPYIDAHRFDLCQSVCAGPSADSDLRWRPPKGILPLSKLGECLSGFLDANGNGSWPVNGGFWCRSAFCVVSLAEVLLRIKTRWKTINSSPISRALQGLLSA